MILKTRGDYYTWYCDSDLCSVIIMATPYLLGIKHKNTNCYVCRPAAKRHKHANSQYMYRRSARLGVPPDCSVCLDPDHPRQSSGRIKLVATSSTLHHVQYAETYEEQLMATVEEMGPRSMSTSTKSQAAAWTTSGTPGRCPTGTNLFRSTVPR